MSLSDQTYESHNSMSMQENNIKNIELLRKDINKLSYEESLTELEKILKSIQDENISLDKIKTNYIKGNLLLQHCEELLQFVEQEINEINPEFLNID